MPIKYAKEKGFKDSTSRLMMDYIRLLKTYGFDDEIIKRIETFKKYYMEMLACYYKGQHSKAYKKFKTSLKCLNISERLFLIPLEDIDYYRARINKNSKGFKLEEMWHIPFDKREIVKTERFSFPGLPCLYFGASAYACWIEMNRPEYTFFQVAKANCLKDSTTEAMLLDIGIVPSALLKKKRKEIQSILKHMFCFGQL